MRYSLISIRATTMAEAKAAALAFVHDLDGMVTRIRAYRDGETVVIDLTYTTDGKAGD